MIRRMTPQMKVDEESAAVAVSAFACYWEIGDAGAGRLVAAPTMRLRRECLGAEKALQELRTGATVVVAGSDMADLRAQLQKRGVR